MKVQGPKETAGKTAVEGVGQEVRLEPRAVGSQLLEVARGGSLVTASTLGVSEQALASLAEPLLQAATESALRRTVATKPTAG